METSTRFPRLFTVNEANALLPVLRPVIECILENLRRLKSRSETVIRDEDLDPDAPDLLARLRQDEGVARLVDYIKKGVDVINGHGCQCKGVEHGLVDFPCMLGREIVFLCWQIGESSVSHWHRIEDGFAGRRPLLDAGASEPKNQNSIH